MPRTNICTLPEVRELTTEIRRDYGNMLTAVDVGRLLGLAHPKAYKAWITDNDLLGYWINGRLRYMAADVATKLWERREQ